MTAEAIAASVLGRQVQLDHDVQRLYDNLHKCEQDMNDLGPRPEVTEAVPNIIDPTAPFGGNRSLGNVLMDAGLDRVEVDAVSSRLRCLTSVLPDLRRGILAASGSTREAAFKGSLAVVDALRAELLSWERSVMASAKQEPFARQWESRKHELGQAKLRARDALRRVSAERIESYKTAVESAATRAELALLRGQLAKKKA
ncbi:hypothetical protein [Aeromonas dhakensis]|uniref:hypothetical protein n=1 Tax=Aeromonas dhakensis TaxID=196024 RepID=UPI0029DD6A01|nr:hypothetical protein [Aeromonas dhakensis]MDX7830357.1 hypothetical protein [Aeromonas dhakensis]